MHPRQVATLIAAARIAIGATLFAAPRPAGRAWIGDAADSGGTQAALRGLGARDVAIGVGTLAALSSGGNANRWLEAGIVADTADAAAAILARKDIGLFGSAVTLLVAGGAAAAGVWLRTEIANQPAPFDELS